ncbi:DinB family protein [Geotalea toluenoxydans]|uniref:DinB family protein n=1 Tax=Geotalea toluenoxydans TaxID=421624 RepID=UPI000AC81E3B|nr:DinB family protein [Geotalea toluenoxydans]
MKGNDLLRKELLALLSGGEAHMDFADVVARFPMEHINSKAPHTPYSCWHFVEHLRIAQWDILQFMIDPDHVSPDYPEGYRPSPDEETDEKGWYGSVEGVLSDLEKLKEIVTDPATDFFAPSPMPKTTPSFGRCSWWPITTPTTSASWPCCARCWGYGRRGSST